MKTKSDRIYRERVSAKGLISFQVAVKETDLWIAATSDLTQEARELILNGRHQLESYIESRPEFLTSLSPIGGHLLAPPLAREMMDATRPLGIGPMASVAGAIAEYVGKGLREFTEHVIVENGGDIFIEASRPVTVSIFAGDSPLSERFGLAIPVRQMPLGVCSSSGTVGHSLSAGTADVVCVLSHSAALADGAATALGNRIQGKRDLPKVAQWAKKVQGILGVLAILGDRMATWGDVQLVDL